MTQALVRASADPVDRARTNYEISGQSFTTVQFAIDAIMNGNGVARAEFDLPRQNRRTREYCAFGFAIARVS